MRYSQDETDSTGVVRNGFDYNLQVWVLNYVVQNVGLNAKEYSGKDVRTLPGHEVRT